MSRVSPPTAPAATPAGPDSISREAYLDARRYDLAERALSIAQEALALLRNPKSLLWLVPASAAACAAVWMSLAPPSTQWTGW